MGENILHSLADVARFSGASFHIMLGDDGQARYRGLWHKYNGSRLEALETTACCRKVLKISVKRHLSTAEELPHSLGSLAESKQ